MVREATCETPGKTMDICERCGNVKESTIPQTEHEYETQVLPATCTSPGYTLNECVVCGDRHITDLTPALSHDYAAKTIPADCETGGKTIHTCAGCGSTFVTDYTEPLGHSWTRGRLLPTPPAPARASWNIPVPAAARPAWKETRLRAIFPATLPPAPPPSSVPSAAL